MRQRIHDSPLFFLLVLGEIFEAFLESIFMIPLNPVLLFFWKKELVVTPHDYRGSYD